MVKILPILSTDSTAKYKTAPSFEGNVPKDFIRPRRVKKIFAYRDFLQYSPIKVDFGEYTIPVHNKGIAQKLKKFYTEEDFSSLFDFAKRKGTFDYSFNPETGLVKTSLINRKENPLMSDLIWTTDTCHNMSLVKKQNPEICTKIFDKLSEFYEKQQTNFDYAIANPSEYQKNPFWVPKVGVGHTFVPSSGVDHHFFARTRLESVGLYLQTASDLILNGFKGEKYGYKDFDSIPKPVIDTISNGVAYLKALNYPQARSCGAWEEQTFMNSLTSDTAIINQAMRDIMRLVYEPTEDKNLLKLRNALLNSKHGKVFENKEEIQKLLKAGEQRIQDAYHHESMRSDIDVPKGEEKLLGRKSDSAMAFAVQTETLNPQSVIGDSIAKIGVLRQLERDLVRDNGALRYQGDNYLNLDYHTIGNVWTNNKHKNEAEWFLVSEISKGYGAVAANLLEEIAEKGSSSKVVQLLDYALRKETEFINRAYARITPKRMTKSNGYSCPAYKVPEAYEAITTKNGVKYVPGAHTPLTWAEASLFEASEKFLDNLNFFKYIDID